MNRRYFVQKMGTLAATGGGVLLAKLAIADRIPAGYIKVYHNYIRGLYYYDVKKAAIYLQKDSKLSLRREPRNRHDKYAIEVYAGNYKLGYLPRAENKAIANMMDAGIDVFAIIRKLNLNDDDLYHGVFVEVYAGVGVIS